MCYKVCMYVSFDIVLIHIQEIIRFTDTKLFQNPLPILVCVVVKSLRKIRWATNYDNMLNLTYFPRLWSLDIRIVVLDTLTMGFLHIIS